MPIPGAALPCWWLPPGLLFSKMLWVMCKFCGQIHTSFSLRPLNVRTRVCTNLPSVLSSYCRWWSCIEHRPWRFNVGAVQPTPEHLRSAPLTAPAWSPCSHAGSSIGCSLEASLSLPFQGLQGYSQSADPASAHPAQQHTHLRF